jgi:hypothetical protein
MASMTSMIGRRIEKMVKFMGEDLQIQKLTTGEMESVQEAAKANESDTDDQRAMKTLYAVIRAGVPSAADMSEADFKTFPVEDLNKLAEEIMKLTGIKMGSGNAP